MKDKILFFFLIFYSVILQYLIYIWSPEPEILGSTGKIVYLHVPLAWISSLAFIIAGIGATLYILKKKDKYIIYANASALIGFIFCLLTTITGSIWAKVMWGSYWNWDPRETSILMLLILYVAYLSFVYIIRDIPNSNIMEASYLIILFIVSPFLIFVLPRMFPSLHPDPIVNKNFKINFDEYMRLVLYSALFFMSIIYLILLKIIVKIKLLEIKLSRYEL